MPLRRAPADEKSGVMFLNRCWVQHEKFYSLTLEKPLDQGVEG